MGVRNFFRVLFEGPTKRRARHSGDDLADEMRSTLAGGAGRSGRITGSGVFRYLENRKRRHRPDTRAPVRRPPSEGA